MDELEKIAPELSKLKKENPYRVPENYFDDFSARLKIRLEAEETGISKNQNKIIQFLKPALGLAAGFAMIIMLAYWPLKKLTPEQEAQNLNNDSDIIDMLYATMVEGIDESSFYALLDNTNGSVQYTDDDLANYVNSNSSEYDIFSETNN